MAGLSFKHSYRNIYTMEKQENNTNLPTELSVLLREESSVKEGLSFKILLERFYLLSGTQYNESEMSKVLLNGGGGENS